jgi:hypothetical protein
LEKTGRFPTCQCNAGGWGLCRVFFIGRHLGMLNNMETRMLDYLYTFYLLSAFIIALFIAWNYNEFVGDAVKHVSARWNDTLALFILFLLFVFVPVLNSLLVLYLGECYVWGRHRYNH